MSPFDPWVRSTFQRARRREAYRRLAGLLGRPWGRPRVGDPLSLDDVSERLGVFEQSYVGIRPIAVRDIVGTVSRTNDFDANFLPRRPGMGERWRRVEQVFADGDFAPISVYEVDGRYFVNDGHHRVAIARQRGVEQIDAEITRLRTRTPLPPDADIGRLIMLEQQRILMEESGLDRARPEARIEFTRPQGYVELLEHIKVHGYHLMLDRGEVLSRDEIAGDWYDHVYLPGVEAIRAEGLYDPWPDATEADLFLWVGQHQRELFPERRMGFQDAARETKARHAPKRGTGKRVLEKSERASKGEPRPTEEAPPSAS